MSRLYRPYIPIAIRVQVALRQAQAIGFIAVDQSLTKKEQLKLLLYVLFGDAKVDLHHAPALVNRRRKKNGDYDPPANSPDHLEYMREDDHDIQTRIRGQHGQHSDLALARKMKRIAKTRDPTRRKTKIPQRVNPWPKGRGFPKRKPYK